MILPLSRIALLLLAGSSLLVSTVSRADDTCPATGPSVLQNNRVILGAPLLYGPVKSLRTTAVPAPENIREFDTSTEIDMDRCGRLAHYRMVRSETMDKRQVVQVTDVKETADGADYQFKVYKQRPGRVDKRPLVTEARFSRDAQQRLTGKNSVIYNEGSDIRMTGSLQVGYEGERITQILTEVPQLMVKQRFSVAYDDAGRVIGSAGDNPPLTQTITLTPEGYPQTQEEISGDSGRRVRMLTECLTRDTHGNCIQEQLTREESFGGDQPYLHFKSVLMIDKTIEYYAENSADNDAENRTEKPAPVQKTRRAK